MVLVGAWNAVARYGGKFIGADMSSNGLIEGQWYMFSLLFLLGAAYTLKRDEHVRVDVLYSRLSPKAQAWVDLSGGVLLLIPFCIFAIVVTWPGIVESISIQEQSPDPGGLPRYPLKAMVPVAFVLLLVQVISELLSKVLVLMGQDPPAGEASASKPEGESAEPKNKSAEPKNTGGASDG